ncbi:MAG: ABC transporter ATP-binding protein [candidate division Zixibacteria bacterium]|nr:ABC transporter ATP-binding protein [candidate division Zixibacteria bacterium]
MNQVNHNGYSVKIENVSKDYSYNGNSATVIKNISLNIKRGELLLILGPSGSGKTTLLTIIAGLLPPSTGDLFLFGKNILEYTKKELQKLRASKIGFVFQTFNLIDAISSLDNIALCGRFAGKSKSDSTKMAKQISRSINIENLNDKFPSNLSQGEKQRVAVARAFINQPELILADEPTASLESSQGLNIIRLLHKYSRQQNKSVVVVSHDRRICQYADRIINIQDGKIQSVETENRFDENNANKQRGQ